MDEIHNLRVDSRLYSDLKYLVSYPDMSTVQTPDPEHTPSLSRPSRPDTTPVSEVVGGHWEVVLPRSFRTLQGPEDQTFLRRRRSFRDL